MEKAYPLINLPLSDPAFSAEEIAQAVGRIVEGRVELVFVDPGYMRFLNRRFRHQDRPTDVLSFDLSDDGGPEGVIYVNGRLCPPLEELLERVFHGYLHLKGWTHDAPERSERMQKRVAEMVSEALGRSR
jgi:probable rRNA maturation factor